MRILHVVHQYAPHYVGGTEIYTSTLAGEQFRRGHEVAVFTRVSQPPESGMHSLQLEAGGVAIYRWWEPQPKGIFSLFRDSYANTEALTQFTVVLNEFRPTIVHFQHLKGLHFRLPALAAVAGARVVLTLHDYWYFCANAQLIRPKGYVCDGPRWWLNCADCAAHRAQAPLMLAGAPVVAALMAQRSHALAGSLAAASVIIAPSRTVSELYGKHTRIGAKLRIIEHGIEPGPPLPPLRRADGSLRILFAGGLAWQKGVHILIEAFTRLDLSLAHLDICGDETSFPEYVARLKQMAHGYAITFHGAVPHARLIELMRASDVLAIPSLWPETASLVALEAQSVGLPILASDVGALRERVQSDADGWLVPPGDVMAWQTALATQMSQRINITGQREAPSIRSHANHVDEIMKEYWALCA